MEFAVKLNYLNIQDNVCIIIGIFESGKLLNITKEFYYINEDYINFLVNQNNLIGKIGYTFLLYNNTPNITKYKCILLVGCGKDEKINEYQYKKILKSIINVIHKITTIEVVYFLIGLNITNITIYWKIRYLIELIEDYFYNFNQFKTTKNKIFSLQKITFCVFTKNELFHAQNAITHGTIISQGIKIAKDLSNTPPNICNAEYLHYQTLKLLKINKNNVKISFMNKSKLKKLGMNAYLAVNSGSSNKPIMSIIEYNGNIIDNNTAKPIIFIGKGVTFDSGGISLKSSKDMDYMKYDMCGAAVVYAIMYIVIKLNLPIKIIGILAGCENMISAKSYRPGDIITTLSGKTVEILNTDAEGRLVLCDVLTYIKRFKPKIVIDIATLTGACVIALGTNITGLMSNCDILTKELILASNEVHDYVWQLPLKKELKTLIKSNIADFKNINNNSNAGAIIGGYFLSNFTTNYNWAHLDIAGTAYNSKGATGRPVKLLSQFLFNYISLIQ